MMHEVIRISNHVSNCRKFLIKPAKNKLTKPSKLYKMIELRLRRFMVTFNFYKD